MTENECSHNCSENLNFKYTWRAGGMRSIDRFPSHRHTSDARPPSPLCTMYLDSTLSINDCVMTCDDAVDLFYKIKGECMELLGDSAIYIEPYSIGFNMSVTCNAGCYYDRRCIIVSTFYIYGSPPVELFRNTILHELAHAAVGEGYGHGEKWLRMAKYLGCNGHVKASSAHINRGMANVEKFIDVYHRVALSRV